MKIQVERLVVEVQDDEQTGKGLYESKSFTVLWQHSGGGKIPADYNGTTEPFGRFILNPLPGCCGVVVSTGSFIEPHQRGQFNPSRWFHDIKEKTARHFGYSTMIMTTHLRNFPEVIGAARSRWKFIHSFRNKRTDNDIGIAIKDL